MNKKTKTILWVILSTINLILFICVFIFMATHYYKLNSFYEVAFGVFDTIIPGFLIALITFILFFLWTIISLILQIIEISQNERYIKPSIFVMITIIFSILTFLLFFSNAYNSSIAIKLHNLSKGFGLLSTTLTSIMLCVNQILCVICFNSLNDVVTEKK